MNADDLLAWARETTLLGIPLVRWGAALAVGLGVGLALRLVNRLLIARVGALARHTALHVDDVLVHMLRGTRPWILTGIALLAGLEVLEPPPRWHDRMSHLWFVLLVVQIALWGSRGVMWLMQQQLERHADLPRSGATATLMAWGLQTALWTTVLLAVLANLGVNITALVTSLGVGGIAVALAVQNILGDLFASLAIALDKPFEVGDAIAIGSVSGTVERIGLKTTRIRAVGGEQIVMANADMLKNAVANYKRQQQRRVEFRFLLAPDTPADAARAVPGIVRELVQAQPKLRFDRAHLKRIADNGLEYEVVYVVEVTDYQLHMDAQQAICLGLIERLQADGLVFGAPAALWAARPPQAEAA